VASKKVIWSLSGKVQQVMRQPIAALPKNLLCCFYGFWQSCNALRVFRFATQAVTFLAVHLSCVRAALVSFIQPRSFLPPLRFITPRSQPAICFHGMIYYGKHTGPTIVCTCLSASTRYNTHWVSLRSLRHSFTSAGFSPPAANNFACLSCLLRLRVCHVFCNLTTMPIEKTKKHAKPLRITLLATARLTPFFVATTLQAHARSVHSFLIPVSLVRHAPHATAP